MLQAPGAVGPVGEQKGVLSVGLQASDQLLSLFSIHFNGLALSVQDLYTGGGTSRRDT